MPSLASHLGGQVINYEAWPAAAWGAETANSGELVQPWERAGGPPKRATVAASPGGLSSLSAPLEEGSRGAGGQSGFYADSR